jgi:hypothetical protein
MIVHAAVKNGGWAALYLEKVQHKCGHNTIPIRQSGVKIVNLGRPALDARRGSPRTFTVNGEAGLLV